MTVSRLTWLILFVILAPILASCGSAQEKKMSGEDTGKKGTTFYLVRHAEKGAGNDPELTAAGTDRANNLAQLLVKNNIKAVYSTNTKRTRATAQPTATAAGVEVQNYDAGDLTGFAEMVKRRHAGESVLIVGHSNSTPNLANILSGNTDLARFSEDDFGNLLEIRISKKGSAKLIEKRY